MAGRRWPSAQRPAPEPDPPCSWPSPDSTGWRRDDSRQVSVAVPTIFGEPQVQWADSRYATWSGPGVWVISDYGTMIDAETLPRGRWQSERDYRSCDAIVDGRPAQVVTYVNPAGTSVVTAFFRDVPPLLPRTRGYFWIRVEYIE